MIFFDIINVNCEPKRGSIGYQKTAWAFLRYLDGNFIFLLLYLQLNELYVNKNQLGTYLIEIKKKTVLHEKSDLHYSSFCCIFILVVI